MRVFYNLAIKILQKILNLNKISWHTNHLFVNILVLKGEEIWQVENHLKKLTSVYLGLLA